MSPSGTAVTPSDERPTRERESLRQRVQSEPQRTDIQGLRAIAVGVVLLYHLWPRRLTGGFVGVDVFFVISGFLITAHLIKRPIRGGRDLLTFWARRIRRLIPAATLVLFGTLLATAIWLPATLHTQVSRHVIAATIYLENWLLARESTDYMAEGDAVSPVQHYWSLSVEEQFYVVWPILVGLIIFIATRRGRHLKTGSSSAVILIAIAAVIVLSLSWSIYLTTTDPAPAYFVTTTRIWELALGGFLAAWLSQRPLAIAPIPRIIAAWAGLAMIALAAVEFDSETSFPGYTAALPVVGTAMVIWASADGLRSGPGRLLALKPMQWLGDVSYAVYLWHWPLIVILPFIVDRDLGWRDKLVILGLSLVLAGATKRFVEDPIRFSPRIAEKSRNTFLMLAACTGIVLLSGLALIAKTDRDLVAAENEAQEQVDRLGQCLGAGVHIFDECSEAVTGFPLSPEVAKADRPDVYADECWNSTPYRSRVTCEYGSPTADIRIALVGNSHAGHWAPPLQAIVEARPEWQLTTYLLSVCYTVDVEIDMERDGDSAGCLETNNWAIDEISSDDFDVVVMSNRTYAPLVGVALEDKSEVAQASYERVIQSFVDAGKKVLVIRDTPAMHTNVPDCLAEHGMDSAECSTPASRAIEDDPLASAAATFDHGVRVLDVTEVFCDEEVCAPVVGGIIAYFDHGHLTATFARTFRPSIEDLLDDLMTLS